MDMYRPYSTHFGRPAFSNYKVVLNIMNKLVYAISMVGI